jgi:hypothetical protein
VLELMNPIALEVGEAHRREMAKQTMRASRSPDDKPRQSAASALAFVAQQVGGQDAVPRMAAPSPTMQPKTDCV